MDIKTIIEKAKIDSELANLWYAFSQELPRDRELSEYNIERIFVALKSAYIQLRPILLKETNNLEPVEEVKKISHTNMGHEFIKGLEPIEEVKVKAFVPCDRDRYWFINSSWEVDNSDYETLYDVGNKKMGNCFRTKEDAQIAQAKVIELFNSFK